MHHSRLCALLIDCNTLDIDQSARFWAEAVRPPSWSSGAWLVTEPRHAPQPGHVHLAGGRTGVLTRSAQRCTL